MGGGAHIQLRAIVDYTIELNCSGKRWTRVWPYSSPACFYFCQHDRYCVRRERTQARCALARWKRLVERTKVPLYTDAEKRQKFYLSLWNLKARKCKCLSSCRDVSPSVCLSVFCHTFHQFLVLSSTEVVEGYRTVVEGCRRLKKRVEGCKRL